MIAYALTIFLGAFLLFQVQPLIGKFILSWFGGTPAVWTTCMLFFQVLLLGGYAYAHATTVWLSRSKQALLHIALLAGSILLLPIIPSEAWKPTGPGDPRLRILLLLAATIGAPYFLLSTTSPLIQRWFTLSASGRSPWRLYALSNLGSLVALVSYPFLVEPGMTLFGQGWTWTVVYGLFAGLCGTCAVKALKTKDAELDETRLGAAETSVGGLAVKERAASSPPPPGVVRERVTTGRIILWLALSAVGSLMLLATTNQMCQEVAVVPFLWVLPLALYLVTFIICFDSPRWYIRPLFMSLLAIAAVFAVFALMYPHGVKFDSLVNRLAHGLGFDKNRTFSLGETLGAYRLFDLRMQIMIYSATMFLACMVCHGELVRQKPSPQKLTLFYLMVSLGGALGGVFVVLIAPAIFNGFWEYHLGLTAVFLLMTLTLFADCRRRRRRRGTVLGVPWWHLISLPTALVALVAALLAQIANSREDVVDSARNFYGVLRVTSDFMYLDGDNGPLRADKLELLHGATLHGFQLQEGAYRYWITSYYGPGTGVDFAVNRHPKRLATENRSPEPMRIGVVGLGTGTLAAQGRPGDVIRFYEINPEVVRISREDFTYRSDSEATVEIVEGDARIRMEREEPQRYDVLVVDAFSSDAIPMHLLTREAGRVYARHLAPGGILAVHISNRYLDLAPVVLALSEDMGLKNWQIHNRDDDAIAVDGSDWILCTNNQAFLDDNQVKDAGYDARWDEVTREPRLFIRWTDNYGALWPILK